MKYLSSLLCLWHRRSRLSRLQWMLNVSFHSFISCGIKTGTEGRWTERIYFLCLQILIYEGFRLGDWDCRSDYIYLIICRHPELLGVWFISGNIDNWDSLQNHGDNRNGKGCVWRGGWLDVTKCLEKLELRSADKYM